MPRPDAIVLPEVKTVDIRIDSVQTIIHSMVLMVKSEDLSGLNPWIYETVSKLTPEQKATHDLVLIGLHYSVLPTRLWKDFPTYLAELETTDPLALRNRILDFYLAYECCKSAEKKIQATREELLANVDFFLEFLENRFGEESVDPEIEQKAFYLLNEPEKMKKLITSHLGFLWKEYFQAEWERVTPMLNDAVLAFEKIDFSGMSREEAAKYITGQDLSPDSWDLNSDEINQLIFIPSAHNGPYLGRFQYKNALGVIFGARLPKDTEMHAPDLSRNEITIRLSALADDVRLNILKVIAESGELRSQEIMDRLDLSQSATSRNLKQLSATGYLVERRCSGAKCYSLDAERVQDTMRAVEAFLLCD
ncbi:MAG: helix-turn-helix domain-containing protein [Anaerolineales bacterium]|nr:helix-turn-helix domain-containing protein [Anaerolineales bacterium]